MKSELWCSLYPLLQLQLLLSCYRGGFFYSEFLQAVLHAYVNNNSVLSTIYPKRRVIIGLCFIPPSIAGNVLLWKSNRDNLPSLLGGLYTVCCLTSDILPSGYS